MVEKIASQAVSSMLHWIGDTTGFHNIVMAGGGVHLFKGAPPGGVPAPAGASASRHHVRQRARNSP